MAQHITHGLFRSPTSCELSAGSRTLHTPRGGARVLRPVHSPRWGFAKLRWLQLHCAGVPAVFVGRRCVINASCSTTYFWLPNASQLIFILQLQRAIVKCARHISLLARVDTCWAVKRFARCKNRLIACCLCRCMRYTAARFVELRHVAEGFFSRPRPHPQPQVVPYEGPCILRFESTCRKAAARLFIFRIPETGARLSEMNKLNAWLLCLAMQAFWF